MADSNPSHKISGAERLYDRIVLGHPVVLLILILAMTGFFIFHIKDFKMDASSDSIVLENDTALRFYSETRKLFASDDSIFITVSPPEGLFTEASLDRIGALGADLEKIDSVESVLSILTVPLYHSPNTNARAHAAALPWFYLVYALC